jgi:pyruvate carboxylase subunit A
MIEAITDYEIKGVATTLPFGLFVCQHEAFVSGKFDTHFVKKYFSNEAMLKTEEAGALVAAELAAKLVAKNKKQLKAPVLGASRWTDR